MAKKFLLCVFAGFMLMVGFTIPVNATGTRVVIVDAALVFHASNAANAAGQIHRGAILDNTSVITNGRRSGHIARTAAANTWGGNTMWVNSSTLSNTVANPQ